MLKATATSLKTQGFKTIVFLGDSGGNLRPYRIGWLGKIVKVINATNYYRANGGDEALVQDGETPQSIGTHAGIRDTSELMAIYPAGVDLAKTSPNGKGNNGDPRRATRARGETLIKLKVDTAVRKIRATC